MSVQQANSVVVPFPVRAPDPEVPEPASHKPWLPVCVLASAAVLVATGGVVGAVAAREPVPKEPRQVENVVAICAWPDNPNRTSVAPCSDRTPGPLPN